MKKKMLTFSLAAVMLAGSVFSVSAAGVKDVLSSDYYASKYSDLKAAYGSDKDAYVAHFLANGAKEGRVMNPILDVVAYRNAYADLNAAFGDDWDAYVNHYLTAGIKEGRVTGVMFNLVDYAEKNPDLKAAYGDDYAALAYQYVTAGIKEGRAGGSMVEEVEEEETPSVSNSGNSGSSDTQKPADPTQKPADPTQKPADPTEKPADPTEKPLPDGNHVHNSKTLGKQGPDNYVATGNSLAATCKRAGYTEYKCTHPIWEYTWDSKNQKWNATIKTDENDNVVRCDFVWEEEEPMGQHVQPVDPVTGEKQNVYLVHPTCTTDGLIKYTCSVCGEHQTEVEEAKGHVWIEENNKVKEFYSETLPKGCKEEEAGQHKWEKECKVCHVRETIRTTPYYGDHEFASYPNPVVPASCTGQGVSKGFCNRCGAEVTVTTPMLDHDFTRVVKDIYTNTYTVNSSAPTHSEWELTVCKYCGLIDSATEVDKDHPCTDVKENKGKGDGYCDECSLLMKRERIITSKTYVKGEIYYENLVQ